MRENGATAPTVSIRLTEGPRGWGVSLGDWDPVVLVDHRTSVYTKAGALRLARRRVREFDATLRRAVEAEKGERR